MKYLVLGTIAFIVVGIVALWLIVCRVTALVDSLEDGGRQDGGDAPLFSDVEVV